MQQTKIDRWLCRKYVHINRIYFNTMPDSLPRGIEVIEAGEESGARYRYRGTTRDEELAHAACDIFASQNITYTARVDERDTAFAKFVGNPKRSVTMMFVWIMLFFISIMFLLSGVTQMVFSNMLQDRDAIKSQDRKDRSDRTERMSNLK